MYCVIFSTLIIGTFVISGQYVESPCPNIFEYRTDSSGIYGIIHLRSTGPVSSVLIRANFTIATRLFTNYVGRLAPIADNLHLLQDFNRGVPIDYRVDFPVSSPLPRLTALIVNDNMLCYGPGDIAGPNQYVTTISLQHALFLKGQGGADFFNTFDQPQSHRKPEPDVDISEFFGPVSNDGQTQIYTFGDDNRNQQNSWNSGLWNQVVTYFYNWGDGTLTAISMNPQVYSIQGAVNYPSFEQPVATRPPQSDPEPQYHPETITQAPLRPQPQPQRPPMQQPRPPPSPPAQSFPTAPSRLPESTGLVQCGIVSGGNERQPLIFNGQTYTRGDWPWLVAIYKRKDGSLNFICSGTLVSERHIVTAAHCMQQKNAVSSQRDIVVKVGVYNLEDWGDDITVTRTLASAYIHESYNATSLANDISVLKLERSVEFNTNIRPACLWSGNTDLSRIVGASGVVAGWGQSELGPAGRGEPRVVRIPVVSTAVCRASRPDFHKLTSSNTLCAGDRKGSGPCLGDSGGGLYLLEGGRWRLRGVVSLSLRPDSGDSTCNLNEYIVFTDSAQYLGWIQTILSY